MLSDLWFQSPENSMSQFGIIRAKHIQFIQCSKPPNLVAIVSCSVVRPTASMYCFHSKDATQNTTATKPTFTCLIFANGIKKQVCRSCNQSKHFFQCFTNPAKADWIYWMSWLSWCCFFLILQVIPWLAMMQCLAYVFPFSDLKSPAQWWCSCPLGNRSCPTPTPITKDCQGRDGGGSTPISPRGLR